MKANIVDVYAERNPTSLIAKHGKGVAKKVLGELASIGLSPKQAKQFFEECIGCVEYCALVCDVEVRLINR